MAHIAWEDIKDRTLEEVMSSLRRVVSQAESARLVDELVAVVTEKAFEIKKNQVSPAHSIPLENLPQRTTYTTAAQETFVIQRAAGLVTVFPVAGESVTQQPTQAKPTGRVWTSEDFDAPMDLFDE